MSAIVRADGDALVMHVGERPYVVVGTQTINISTHGLNLDAMTGMLTQLLPADSHTQLEEFGAVEYRIPQQGDDRFTVVAARGGDDIWIEIRRRRAQPAVVAATEIPTPQEAAPIVELPVAQVEPEPIQAEPEAIQPEPVPVPVPEPEPVPEPMVVVNAQLEPVVIASEESAPESVPASEPAAEPVVMQAPELEPLPVFMRVTEPEPQVEPVLLEVVAPEPELETITLSVVGPEPEIETVIMHVTDVEPELETVIMQVIDEVEPEPEPEPVIDLFRELEAYAEAAPAPAPQLVPVPQFVPEPEIVPEPAIVPEPEIVPEIAAAVPEPEPDVFQIDSHEPELPVLAEAPPEPAVEPIAEPVAELVVEPQIEIAQPEPMPIAASIEAPEPVQAPAPLPPPAPPIEAPGPMPIAASIEQPPPMPIAASIEPPPVTPGVVLPMTRTVRIEVPPRTPTRAASGIDRLLRIAAARGATALFLTSDSRPWIRVEGDLRYLDSETPLSRADVESAILEIAPESGHESIGKGEPTEWLAEFADVGRIRCTTFSDHRGPGVLLRMIATRAATAEQLGLAREVQALATEPQGLVLVAGPRTSGKSTLISALVDLVNRQRAEFVITLERQIRLVHDNKSALVSQREIRGGAEESVAAARAALRENPDVLIVDDLVSPHLVPLLLTAASEGLLVFVSITAPSTADAVQRFVELAPPEMRKAVQSAMAESFRGAVAQVLLKKAGGGLIAAREVLLATAPVTRVISEGQLGQLPLALESGRKHGMVSFTDALAEFVRGGTVDLREAFRKAPDRNRLLETLKRDGIDTSVVERLA